MREHQPKYVEQSTLIALVLMLLSGGLAVQRFLTAEQPGLAPDVHSRRFANNLLQATERMPTRRVRRRTNKLDRVFSDI